MNCSLCPVSGETYDAEVVKHRMGEHKRLRRSECACALETADLLMLLGGAGNG